MSFVVRFVQPAVVAVLQEARQGVPRLPRAAVLLKRRDVLQRRAMAVEFAPRHRMIRGVPRVADAVCGEIRRVVYDKLRGDAVMTGVVALVQAAVCSVPLFCSLRKSMF